MATSFQVESRQRVTAGLPGLTPEKRGRADYFWVQREKLNGLIADVEGRKRAAAAPDGGRPTHIREAQKGIELKGSELINRIRKMNPSLWFEVANSDHTKMGVYHLDPKTKEKRFICGFEREVNPEFETKIVDERGEVKKCLRGYRTVLARLIRNKFVSSSAVFALFGPPSRDSENWMRFTT